MFSVTLSIIVLVGTFLPRNLSTYSAKLSAVYGGNLGGHMQIDMATQEPLHPDQFITFSKVCVLLALHSKNVK